ncbi:unnamed protein product [Heligmosomoides polygyrus]|uniref:Uncharacterized protein n=1 Tax=Heligmosomoides polygyrus TaxID=6339 RepID=A0A183FF88_HELPZ|nr:unnamed protein product [Heligmosomoides polygyrus]
MPCIRDICQHPYTQTDEAKDTHSEMPSGVWLAGRTLLGKHFDEFSPQEAWRDEEGARRKARVSERRSSLGSE